jgi:manganese-dependent inorganic pyrophosphatase
MKTYVCGHRNPDVDSVMSAYALADLRRRTGLPDVEALCAGRLPPKAKWVCDRFGLKGIRTRRDVYVRVRDLINPLVPAVDSSMTLEEALRLLAGSGESSLPVRDAATGAFLGMLSPAKLLNLFIAKADLSMSVADAPLHLETLVLLANDRVHDVKAAAIRNAHNHFPVVDETGILLGTVLKRAFAEKPPFRIILVDHNEAAQGIPGVEELPVVEVVDHHRISFAPTADPIKYTADVVGATCTLVAQLFRAAGERPTKEIAAALLAGIVADTLLFQSPTTTDTDRLLCAWLEKLCGLTAEEMMKGLMSVQSPLASMSPAQAVAIDAKRYTENGRAFVLAQIEESQMTLFHQKAPALREAMDRAVAEQHLDFMALMVTDPVSGCSELLFSGNDAVRRALPYRRGPRGTFLMPGVLSRKKQLLPEILAALV